MKKPLFILLITAITLSGCGDVFGGDISSCQRHAPAPGQPERKVRPAALIADLVCFPFEIISLPIDLISGAMYVPCEKDSASKATLQTRIVKDTLIQKKYFTVSIDVAQYVMLQPNIGIEYRRNNLEFGLNFGLVFPWRDSVNILANGQYKWPAPIYYGEAFRAYCKFYNPKKIHRYWAVQAVVKTLWYHNRGFMDQPDGDESQVYYTMSENATVLGIDVLNGKECRMSDEMHLDIFWGVGFHDRLRTFEVTKSSDGGPGSYLPLGTYKGYIDYLTPVFGMKLGFSFLHKQAKPIN
jgi:hypothetical protein